MALGTCLNLIPSVSYLWKYLEAACGGHPSLVFSTEGGIFHFYLPLVILPKIGWRMWETGVLRKSQVSFMFMIYSFASRLKKNTSLGMTTYSIYVFQDLTYTFIYSHTHVTLNTSGIYFCVWFEVQMELYFLSQIVEWLSQRLLLNRNIFLIFVISSKIAPFMS